VTDLKPCPFCGSSDIDAAFAKWGDGAVSPGCMSCGATANTQDDWNTRAQCSADSEQRWYAVDEVGNDNFATSIYEAGDKGLLVARCNQNGQYPWQAPSIIRGLAANKTVRNEPQTASRYDVIEECAIIADDHTPAKHEGTLAAHVTGRSIAAAIRSLKTAIEPHASRTTQRAAAMTERLIQAAVDYESGRCSRNRLAASLERLHLVFFALRIQRSRGYRWIAARVRFCS